MSSFWVISIECFGRLAPNIFTCHFGFVGKPAYHSVANRIGGCFGLAFRSLCAEASCEYAGVEFVAVKRFCWPFALPLNDVGKNTHLKTTTDESCSVAHFIGVETEGEDNQAATSNKLQEAFVLRAPTLDFADTKAVCDEECDNHEW